MADAPPRAKKPAGPMRWILLGCGALVGLMVLGFSGCAGIMYVAYKGTDPVADVGTEYLRKSPEVQAAFGAPAGVRRHMFG